MSIKLKGLAGLVAALLILALSIACGGGGEATATATPTLGPSPTTVKAIQKVSLALDWYPWSNHTGLYMALERGYYQDEGLEVDIYVPSNPEDVLKTVGAGRDDFGISYQSDVLLARAQGIPVVSIAALVQHPLNSIMALKTSGITRPRDLMGKTIGVTGIPGEQAMLSTMLQYDGIDIKDVELVTVGFDLVPALIGKRVDAIVGAYWVHESILAEMEGFPVNIMRMEQWGVPDFYELVLVTNEKTISKNPDMVRRFMSATVKGYRDAIANPQGAVDILIKHNPDTNKALEERGVTMLAPLWLEGELPFGWQEESKWRSFADWMRQNGLLEGEVDVASAFTNELLPK